MLPSQLLAFLPQMLLLFTRDISHALGACDLGIDVICVNAVWCAEG